VDRFDRIYQLHRILAGRRVPISLDDLTTELECSEPTVKRVIRTMRDHLDAPIEYDRERSGYLYAGDGISANWELAGLWFSASELQALLALERLLSGLSPGLLAEELHPFRQRIESLLQRQEVGTGELYARLRILAMGARSVRPALFRTIATALGSRKRLELGYRGRSRNEPTRRRVSPQRLVHYRDNWYLDGWCHMRNGLRIFAVDRIDTATLAEEVAKDLDEADLDQRLARSYGIFSGVPRANAILRFTADMARWVADERWHPQQQGQWLTDGHYELTIPFADPTELVRDILRYGSDVEVVRPASLRRLVQDQLTAALNRYRITD
jgi:predicted DNA-binding transcriptional regulator YafY